MFEDFLLTVQIVEPVIANTEILVDNVGLFYHDFNAVFTSVLESQAFDFNHIHVEGWNLKKINATA